MKLNATRLEQALEMLAGNMDLANTPEIHLVVCGGASLIATKVVFRTTKDVDIVAFRTMDGTLIAPGYESIAARI